MPAIALNERITRLESEVSQLSEIQRNHSIETEKINKKLDELLALKNKGVGVFWIISVLFGIGVTQFMDMFSSLFHGR